MPIGKNAIKRVASNGYSNVKTEAPDMENSTVAEEKSAVAKKASAPKKPASKATSTPAVAKKSAPAPKKVASAPKKSMETEPSLSPVATAKRVTKKTVKAPKRECDYIAIGEELPIYLL